MCINRLPWQVLNNSTFQQYLHFSAARIVLLIGNPQQHPPPTPRDAIFYICAFRDGPLTANDPSFMSIRHCATNLSHAFNIDMA